MKSFKIDPRLFISPPYIKCPKCGKNSFGVLIINKDHYIRRCKECFFPRRNETPIRYYLPKLNKKVIYIDQFAISNMMKILNPQTKSYQKGSLDMFWLQCFEKLDSLCKLQLIICPDSGFHTNESLLSPFYKALKRMYELLSGGVTFEHSETIKRFQLYHYATNWITGNKTKEIDLDINSVVRGEINVWQDRLIISVNINYSEDWLDDLRRVRDKTSESLCNVFKEWQNRKDKTFNDWFEIKSMSFGRTILKIYLEYLELSDKISAGKLSPMEAYSNIPHANLLLIRSIKDAFIRAGMQEKNVWIKTGEYLLSPSLKNIPFIKISSMLYAALARKAAAGRKKPPNQGMTNDIEIISTLLPYCDAMFIDNECHSYLKEKPLCDNINYGTKIFSQNNKEKFLEYLNDIEKNTPKKHFDKVCEVYGDKWKEPYTTLYKK
jgi:hypothetical protein